MQDDGLIWKRLVFGISLVWFDLVWFGLFAFERPDPNSRTHTPQPQPCSAEGDGFETSASGLQSKILKEGTGAVPAPGQTINGAC